MCTKNPKSFQLQEGQGFSLGQSYCLQTRTQTFQSGRLLFQMQQLGQWHVDRRQAGNNSTGTMKVALVGPNVEKKHPNEYMARNADLFDGRLQDVSIGTAVAINNRDISKNPNNWTLNLTKRSIRKTMAKLPPDFRTPANEYRFF
ncbi:hypothetical protein SUGI_0428560 [Cryptomeria japonica]|nr:hypothetical protein SUGI_0428560 [Cryptomeria japonica]